MRVCKSVGLLVLSLVLAGTSTVCVAKKSPKDLPPRYRTWLNDEVVYIINSDERDAFLKLPTDDDRDKFISHFWEIRNPTPGAPDNSYKDEIYKRIEYAKQYLGGVHTDMGQVYITLGEPKQRAKYYGREEVRPMEIWFYQNVNPALPPYFYVVFFDRDSNGSMRLYSPYMDGPSKLATSVLTVNDNLHSFQAIDRALGREVARTTLSLLPDAPVDMQGATASLESDVLLANIKNLANHPLTKEELHQRELAESVTHRIILDEQFLDVLTIPLRDAAGQTNLHYLLRLHRPADFAIAQANDRFYYDVEVSARVYGTDSKLIFKQEKEVSKYLDIGEADKVRHSLFGYEGWLPLASGKYKIDFLMTNKLTKTAYRASRNVVIPATTNGVLVGDIIPFSQADGTSPGQSYLPFSVGNVRFLPSTGEQLIFAPGQNLDVFYQIWTKPEDPVSAAGKKLQVEYGYGRPGVTGDSKTIRDLVDKQQIDSYGSLLSGKRLSLANLPVGSYRLVVSVLDPDSSAKAYSSLPFQIAQGGPQGSPPYDVYDPDLAQEAMKGVPDFNRALCYLAQDDKDSALIWFKSALEKDPSNEIARARLSELYFAKQDYANVVALFARSPITDQTDEQAILRGADSMARTGDRRRAISLLEDAINFRKKSGPLYLALAGYYRDSGNALKATEMESKGRALETQSNDQ